jgi:hypothetical protein
MLVSMPTPAQIHRSTSPNTQNDRHQPNGHHGDHRGRHGSHAGTHLAPADDRRGRSMSPSRSKKDAIFTACRRMLVEGV